MRKIRTLLGAAVLAALALAGVISASAATGGEVSITLSENPTTGFQWTYKMDKVGVLKETYNKYTTSKARAGIAGASGEHTWRFAPVKDGEVTLTFTYARVWENKANNRTAIYKYSVKNGKAELTESPELSDNATAGTKAAPAAAAPSLEAQAGTKINHGIAEPDTTLVAGTKINRGIAEPDTALVAGNKINRGIAEPDTALVAGNKINRGIAEPDTTLVAGTKAAPAAAAPGVKAQAGTKINHGAAEPDTTLVAGTKAAPAAAPSAKAQAGTKINHGAAEPDTTLVAGTKAAPAAAAPGVKAQAGNKVKK